MGLLYVLLTILMVIAIISFLIVFVLGVAVKLDTAFGQDFMKEFWKHRAGRVASVSLIISVGLLFTVQAFLNRYARHEVLAVINNTESKIYVNQVIIDDSVLYKDFKRLTNTSSSRNTGDTKIEVDIKQNHKTIHLSLLRDFSHRNKYWVSSEEYGENCFGEINTKQLNYIK